MADEKPKTLQEQSSPTGPPVSQEVKDTAPAVAQPDKEKDKAADTKAVEVKETEAAGSKKLDDIVKQVKEAQQKQTEASPAAPGKNSPLLLLRYLICQRPDKRKPRNRSPQKRLPLPKRDNGKARTARKIGKIQKYSSGFQRSSLCQRPGTGGTHAPGAAKGGTPQGRGTDCLFETE